jgi:hypothetical protein
MTFSLRGEKIPSDGGGKAGVKKISWQCSRRIHVC